MSSSFIDLTILPEHETTDRLFALFVASFTILAVQRVALALTVDIQAHAVWLYSLRLVAFLLILAAVMEKNRSRPARA